MCISETAWPLAVAASFKICVPLLKTCRVLAAHSALGMMWFSHIKKDGQPMICFALNQSFSPLFVDGWTSLLSADGFFALHIDLAEERLVELELLFIHLALCLFSLFLLDLLH